MTIIIVLVKITSPYPFSVRCHPKSFVLYSNWSLSLILVDKTSQKEVSSRWPICLCIYLFWFYPFIDRSLTPTSLKINILPTLWSYSHTDTLTRSSSFVNRYIQSSLPWRTRCRNSSFLPHSKSRVHPSHRNLSSYPSSYDSPSRDLTLTSTTNTKPLLRYLSRFSMTCKWYVVRRTYRLFLFLLKVYRIKISTSSTPCPSKPLKTHHFSHSGPDRLRLRTGKSGRCDRVLRTFRQSTKHSWHYAIV